MTAAQPTTRWLSLSQAQAYSGLGRDMLRDLADTGHIRAGWTGGNPGKGHRRWDRESIDQYLTQGEARGLEILQGLRL
ncbi:MAG: helix-turn-helix domain-containing protein [Deltaproteobacteria bacterium]|nr:helix-turn-helix domain-containing protein [Deltaproteobacteria bacterium]